MKRPMKAAQSSLSTARCESLWNHTHVLKFTEQNLKRRNCFGCNDCFGAARNFGKDSRFVRVFQVDVMSDVCIRFILAPKLKR